MPAEFHRDGSQWPLFDVNESTPEDGIDVASLPYSSFDREWLPDNSVYSDVFKYTNLSRLREISQLSLLSSSGIFPGIGEFEEVFKHNRLDHSLTIARIGEEILTRNRFSERDINVGIIAFLMHDIRDPAYGDATMKTDPARLSEEDSFLSTVTDKERILFEKYGTTPGEISDIIKNEGVLGKVLDVVDRLVYTVKDLHEIVGSDYKKGSGDKLDPELREILKKYPDFGNLVKHIGVDQKTEEIYFSHPEMLETFLRVRAYLHKNLYYHPFSQGRDFLFSKLLAGAYMPGEDSGAHLTPNVLRQMNDWELTDFMKNQYGFAQKEYDFKKVLTNWYPEFKRYDTKQQAEEAAELLKKNGSSVLGVQERPSFNTCTNYLVIPPGTNRAVPFYQYASQEARAIQQIAKDMPGYFVYYKNLSDDDSEIADLIRLFSQ